MFLRRLSSAGNANKASKPVGPTAPEELAATERLASLGKASALSPTPSPSVSNVSVGSFGKASLPLITPSLSVSSNDVSSSKPEPA